MRKTKKHSTLSNTIFALFWQFRVAPFHTLFTFAQVLFGDLLTMVKHTFLLAYIVACVEEKRPFGELLYVFVPIMIFNILKLVIEPIVSAYVEPRSMANLQKDIQLKLYEKAVSMEIAKYDNATFYNDFVWAMQKAPEHITAATGTCRNLLGKLAVVLCTGAFIVTTDAIALGIVALVVLVTFLSQRVLNKWRMEREEEILPVSRKRDYVNRVFYLADYVKDIKTSRISEKLEKDFAETSGQMQKLVKKHGPRLVGVSLAGDSVRDFVYDGVYLSYLFYQAIVQGRFGLGALMALYNAATRLSNNLRQLVKIFPEFQQHSLYIEKLRTFLETENEMSDHGSLPVPEYGDILLNDVHFTYPGNAKATIKGVSMKIKQGEKIALVGFNGAGKSTLIKLLLRLYDPDSGCIQFAGQSIQDYPVSEYRKRYGVLFQDFEMIATDIRHNLNMQDAVFDENKAEEVLKKTAFWDRFQTMPDGYSTQLTKEFSESGVNLSGGEAQKLAMARVLYADPAKIILDEPSSALDPIAEYRLNKTVTELAEDKTVIIISHRLSTTRFVDKIYMLEDGRIVEQGNHETLMALDGKYAQMFKLQAEKYR